MALPLYKRLIVLRLLPSVFFNQVLVEITSRHIAVITIAAGLKKTVIDRQFLAVNAPDDVFNQLTIALAQQKKHKKQKNSLLKVVVASEFVRYLALPAHHISMNNADKSAYARAAYHEVYGNMVDDWQIQCDDAAPNQITIVAAMDQQLITHLTVIAEKSGLELVSVQPQLMPVFNQLKHALNLADVYFGVVESNRLLFAHLQNGHWQSLRSVVLESDWQSQLSSLAKREQLLTETNDNKLLMIYAPTHESAKMHMIEGWTVKRIGLSAINNTEKHYAMLEVA